MQLDGEEGRRGKHKRKKMTGLGTSSSKKGKKIKKPTSAMDVSWEGRGERRERVGLKSVIGKGGEH